MSGSESSGQIPPVYAKLKDLCLTTDLVRGGEPARDRGGSGQRGI